MAAVLTLSRHRSAEFYRASLLPFLRDRSVRVVDVRLTIDDGVIADRRRWTVYDDDRTGLAGKIAGFLILDDLQSMVIARNAYTGRSHMSRLPAPAAACLPSPRRF
jgi:hypothetical protein